MLYVTPMMPRKKTLRLVVALLSTVISAVAAQSNVDVSGTVRDQSTTQPVNGAVVELASATKRFTARTDEAGEFFVRDVDLDTYRVTVRRIGYMPMRRDLDVRSGMKPVTLRIDPIPQALAEVRVRGEGTGIYGRVARSGDFEPIRNAQVYVGGTRDSVVTDSTGAFFISLKRPGSFMVRVRAPGYVDDSFVIDVKRNQVADASRLLDIGDGHKIPPGLWKDFDQRLIWQDAGKSALMPGSEIRKAGATIAGALQQSGMMVSRSMRLGPSVCVFVDGQPRPGYPLNMIRVEEVKAMEVYAGGADSMLLMQDWPPRRECTATGERVPRGQRLISAIVIWTK
jgi:hypothetical protein